MSDKYNVGTLLLCNNFVGKVIDNFKLPSDVCVEWETGQKASYDESWLDENADIVEEE